MLSDEQIIDKVKEIFDTKFTCLRYCDKAKMYRYEIYADYRDSFGDADIKEIFSSNDAREALLDKLYNFYINEELERNSEILKGIKESLDRDINYEDYTDVITEWVSENITYDYPEEHYLKQELKVNIIVDTGDGNYDYTCNELFGCNYSEKGIKDGSSLVWLMGQQGYSEKQIKKFVEYEDYQGSKLLKSVYAECINTSSCTNALIFLINMTLGEYLTAIEKMAELKETGVIIISADTECGLFDFCNGSGSTLEISLEKDVELPIKYINSMKPDGCKGYSVAQVYGTDSSIWHGDIKEIKNPDKT